MTRQTTLCGFGTFAVLAAVAGSPPLTLDEAINIAHEQARDVVRARADVLIVDTQRARTVGAILPRVDLSVRGAGTIQREVIVEAPYYVTCADCTDRQPTLVTPDAYFNADGFRDQHIVDDLFIGNFNATLSVQQLVYDGGRWWTEIARFDDIRRVREATLREVEANVRLNVVQTFYGLERSLRGLERFELRERLGQEQLDSALRLERAGQGGDVAVAQRNLAEDRLALARARFDMSRSRRAFNLSLARPANTPVVIVLPPHVSTSSTSIPRLTFPKLEPLLEAARENRGALEVQRANVDQVAKLVDVRRAARWPVVTVGGRYTRLSRRADRVFAERPDTNFYAGFDVTMRWNLYRGGIDESVIDETSLELHKAIVEKENVERSVMSEVEDRLENLKLQIQIYALSVLSVAPASEAVVAQRQKYAAGQTTILSLRDAELKYTQAQLGAINARLAVEIARELLRRAVGTDLIVDEYAKGPD